MNPGVESIFGLLVQISRWTGGLEGTEAQRAEARGIEGILNLEFLDDEPPRGWHLRFRDGRVSIREGLSPSPRATARLRAEDFLDLVSGRQSYAVSRMTGKVRVTGDGAFGVVFGAFLGGLRAASGAPGLRGWAARGFFGWALRRGGQEG